MNSQITKFFYELTPDKILDSVEDLGVRCTGRVLPLNSLENRVYEVEIELEDDQVETAYDRYRVIKFYRPGRWSKEQIQEEHDFLFELAEQDLPVVPPIRFPDGTSFKEIKSLESDDSSILGTIFPKVGGRILGEFSDQQIEMLGRLIARMHQVGSNKQAEHRLTLNIDSFGRENCKYLEEEILPPEIKDRYSQLVNMICDVSAPWFEGVPLQRVHGDCHLGNILWQDEFCHLVDFDDFVMGPAVQDLWLIVPGREEYDLKQRKLLVDSYSSMKEFDYETVRLIEPLRALRLVHFSAWIARRWQDPAFQNVFTDFGSPQYWREQLIALEEVNQIMQTGEIA